jgi:hypothetical protein
MAPGLLFNISRKHRFPLALPIKVLRARSKFAVPVEGRSGSDQVNLKESCNSGSLHCLTASTICYGAKNSRPCDRRYQTLSVTMTILK